MYCERVLAYVRVRSIDDGRLVFLPPNLRTTSLASADDISTFDPFARKLDQERAGIKLCIAAAAVAVGDGF